MADILEPAAPRRLRPRGGTPRRFPPVIPAVILTVFVLCGIFGRIIVPTDPNKQSLRDSLLPPVWDGGKSSHLLGTDQLGRDVLARLISGAQVSFLVALGAVAIAGALGLVVALVSGYRGGRIDTLLTRIADSSMAFPVLLLAVIIVAIYGKGLAVVIIVLVLATWPQYARVLRSEVIRIRDQDFVVMSRTLGGSGRWIIVRHVLPNVIPTLLVLATLQMGLAIIAEGSLSFLGIGVPPPTASWGNMLADGRSYMNTAWWMPVLPGICLSLTVLSANLLGDWLRDALDPSTRR